MNDGDDNTAWVTYANRPAAEEWWYVDLGSVYDLSAIAVLWGDDYSSEYILQVRTDAPADEDKANDEAWTNIVPSAITTATANGTVFSEVTAQGRYVRLHSLARSTFNCIRLKEVRIFGVEHVDAGVLVESITLDQTEKTI